MRVTIKKMMWLPLLAIILLSSLTAYVVLAAPTVVELYPAVLSCEPYDPAVPPGRTYFTVTIKIADVVGLAAWEAKVRWDPAVLECMDVKFGTFMDPLNPTSVSLIEMGKVTLGQYATMAGGVGGSGDLAYLNFTVLYPGKTLVFFESINLYDQNGVGKDCDFFNAQYHSHTPVPVWYHTADSHTLPYKVCKIDCHEVQLGDNVTFNGTESWDPDTPADEIVSYEWYYGDGYYSNDIRLTNFKGGVLPIGRMEDSNYRPHGLVLPMDLDVGTPLVPFLPEETHVDDGNGLYDMGEPICWDNDTDLVFNATMGDYVIFPPAGIVPDGTPLVNFATTTGCGHVWPREKHCDNEYPDEKYTAGEEIYEDRDGPIDDGYSHVSAGASVMNHMYLDYRYEAYHAWLGVLDATGKYWQSNWYVQQSFHDIRLWRDVALVNIWPTLDFTDSVSYFWPPGSGYKGYGQLLVAVANYGSITEYVHVEVFAVRIDYRTKLVAGEWQTLATNDLYVIEDWLWEVNPMSGSGFWLLAGWTPPKKGVYAIVAKVDLLPCTHAGLGAGVDPKVIIGGEPYSWWTDIWGNGPNEYTEWADPQENNVYIMPKPLLVFDNALDYAVYCMNVDGDGKVEYGELFALGKLWFKTVGC